MSRPSLIVIDPQRPVLQVKNATPKRPSLTQINSDKNTRLNISRDEVEQEQKLKEKIYENKILFETLRTESYPHWSIITDEQVDTFKQKEMMFVELSDDKLLVIKKIISHEFDVDCRLNMNLMSNGINTYYCTHSKVQVGGRQSITFLNVGWDLQMWKYYFEKQKYIAKTEQEKANVEKEKRDMVLQVYFKLYNILNSFYTKDIMYSDLKIDNVAVICSKKNNKIIVTQVSIIDWDKKHTGYTNIRENYDEYFLVTDKEIFDYRRFQYTNMYNWFISMLGDHWNEMSSGSFVNILSKQFSNAFFQNLNDENKRLNYDKRNKDTFRLKW